ncbi:MAG: regulatory protein RecX [Planctomycetota bacterium]
MDTEGHIEIKPSGPDRWRLATPDGTRATLDNAALADHNLVHGDPWTLAVQERVGRAIGEAGARLAAHRLLRVRPRSEAELRERLATRYPAAAVERVIEAMRTAGVIDDERLAGTLAEQMADQRPHAREAIRERLERFRIGDPLIHEALDEHAPEEHEADRALAVAEAQLRRLAGLNLTPEATRRRLFAALARRGFEPELAADAIERLVGMADDPE